MAVFRLVEVGALGPKPKTKAGNAQEVYVPRRRHRRPGAADRGRAVQTFLDRETSERFDQYLERHAISISDCLRWLVTNAIANDLEPPASED